MFRRQLSPLHFTASIALGALVPGCLTPDAEFSNPVAEIPQQTGETGGTGQLVDDPVDPIATGGATTSVPSSGGMSMGGMGMTPVTTNHCENREKDADETDIDCGGLDCDKCRDLQECSIPDDCQNGSCAAGICQPTSCTDGEKNGSETDVDCGGGGCAPCLEGDVCAGASDCLSGVCMGGSCLAATCEDGVTNGDETDEDCGGDVCDPCELGESCNDAGDCPASADVNTTVVCSAGVCDIECASGTEDCDLDGVCDDVSSGDRCGGCLPGDAASGSGTVCAEKDFSSAMCSADSCVWECDPGRVDTNNDLSDTMSNGCEDPIPACAASWNAVNTYTFGSQVSQDSRNWECVNLNCRLCRPIGDCAWEGVFWTEVSQCF